MSDPEFVTVRGRITEASFKAVLFVVGDSRGPGEWVPRVWIHEDDREAISRAALYGQEREVRMAKWKADELGLTAARIEGAASGDLFGGDPA